MRILGLRRGARLMFVGTRTVWRAKGVSAEATASLDWRTLCGGVWGGAWVYEFGVEAGELHFLPSGGGDDSVSRGGGVSRELLGRSMQKVRCVVCEQCFGEAGEDGGAVTGEVEDARGMGGGVLIGRRRRLCGRKLSAWGTWEHVGLKVMVEGVAKEMGVKGGGASVA